MTYVFIRRYNPAYDVVIRRYFAEQGLPSTDSLTPLRARIRARAMERKSNLTAAQTLYLNYLREWENLPDLRPAFYRFVDRLTGGVGQPDVGTLSQLERELTPEQGKFLFTMEEAAEQIADFYHRYMANPLRRDLAKQASRKVLLRFFSQSDLAALPDNRKVSAEEFDRACRNVALKLSARLDKITPDAISAEISSALVKHNRSAGHMKAAGEGRERNWACSHQPGYVELSAIALQQDALPTMFLQPTEGFLIADELLGAGWNDYAFPMYFVKQK